MLCTSGSQTPGKAEPTDLQEPRIPTTALRWESIRHFLFLAIAIAIVVLTALSRYPQCLFRQPIFQPWRSLLFASPTLQDGFPLSTLETILHSEPNASRAADWSYYYTSQSHLPGEGKAQGLWTKKKWEDFGIPETEIVKYNASISTPILQRLALIDTSETLRPSVIYEAKLMEELPFNDPSEIRTLAFHGQSSSGNVTAQFVYANFGREQDYNDLEQNHVDIKGKIAIVKYGMVYRGAKMSTAAERGLFGILIYSDPQQDGNITEGHGYKGYPDGPARPETCIERGSIGSIRESYA
jgi:N-acetylated-alpha-linked acidic dipeptidase